MSPQVRTSVEPMPSAELCVNGADIICTVTASREPVLQGAWIRSGAHINAVGAALPTARELDTAAVARSLVFVDRRESALAEAGDILIPISEGAFTADHIRGDVGGLLTGSQQGRESSGDVTLLATDGAFTDLAIGPDGPIHALRSTYGEPPLPVRLTRAGGEATSEPVRSLPALNSR